MRSVEEAIDEAARLGATSKWTIEIVRRGRTLVEVFGRGNAAGRAFSTRRGPVQIVVDGREGNSLAALVEEVDGALSSLAVKFHRLLPLPAWTRAKEDGLDAVGKVHSALSEYQGSALRAITLGPVDWIAFASAVGRPPVAAAIPLADGIEVRPGRDLRYVIDPA